MFTGNFQLHIKQGQFTDSEIIVMLGENGTGKTTFIRMLAGRLEPDEGGMLCSTDSDTGNYFCLHEYGENVNFMVPTQSLGLEKCLNLVNGHQGLEKSLNFVIGSGRKLKISSEVLGFKLTWITCPISLWLQNGWQMMTWVLKKWLLGSWTVLEKSLNFVYPEVWEPWNLFLAWLWRKCKFVIMWQLWYILEWSTWKCILSCLHRGHG